MASANEPTEPTGQGASEESTDPSTNIAPREVWKPNEEYLHALMGMGISRNAAEKGLYCTGNQSADLAALWVFEHTSDTDLEDPLVVDDEDSREWPAGQHQYKMVFVVNHSLGMGVGKTAAQVAHAAIGLFRQLMQSEEKLAAELMQWEEQGETSVTLRADNAEQLASLHFTALEKEIPAILIYDAGRTQVAPDSVTVMGIFGQAQRVDQITGVLRLL